MKTSISLKRCFKKDCFVVIAICILAFSSSAFAYAPPFGIPDPGMWGATHPIDDNAPSTAIKCIGWPMSESLGCYYIDNSKSNATDTNNIYGYPDKPRLTLPITKFPAGSYVELHGGPYSSDWNLVFNGTAESPCWFKGNASSMPTLSNRIRFQNSTYLFVEYLKFDGGTNNCISVYGTSGNNIVVRNSIFKNRAWVSNTSGIGIIPDQGYIMHDIVIYNNEFSTLGNWLEVADQDFHGINPNLSGRTTPTELHHIWMLNNSFYHLSGNGIQVNAGSDAMIDNLHHMYMGKNIGHANRQSVLWSKQANHVIISQNTCYDSRKHGSQPGDGIGYQYGPDNLWIIFNDIYDSNHGIRQSDTSVAHLDHNSYIIGNKIHNIHPGDIDTYNPADFYRQGQAIALWAGNMSRHILDNTIYDVHGGVCINHDAPVEISGNIISGIYAQDFHVSNNNAQTVTTLNYNMFYPSARFKWTNTYTSLAAFSSAVGECGIGCSEADPLFISTLDLRLQSKSPAINSGVENSAYDTFYKLYHIDIKKDIEGNTRPQAGSWDIGAYEASKSIIPAPIIDLIVPK